MVVIRSVVSRIKIPLQHGINGRLSGRRLTDGHVDWFEWQSQLAWLLSRPFHEFDRCAWHTSRYSTLRMANFASGPLLRLCCRTRPECSGSWELSCLARRGTRVM